MPQLTIVKGPFKGQKFSFDGEAVFIGRSAENDVQLKIGQVSRKHFKIYRVGEKSYITDLESKNGTFLGSEAVAPGTGVEIKDNDIIRIANSELKVTGLLAAEKEPKRDVEVVLGKVAASGKERRTGERKNLDLIWGVTELLRQNMGMDEILQKVIDYIMDSLPRIDTAVIALYDKKRKEVWDTVAKSKEKNKFNRIEYSKEIINRVLRQEKSTRMSDMKYEAPEDITDSITELGIKSVMCVPMISSGSTLGAIYVDSRGPYGFRKDDLLLLNSLSGPVAVAVEKAILAATLGHAGV